MVGSCNRGLCKQQRCMSYGDTAVGAQHRPERNTEVREVAARLLLSNAAAAPPPAALQRGGALLCLVLVCVSPTRPKRAPCELIPSTRPHSPPPPLLASVDHDLHDLVLPASPALCTHTVVKVPGQSSRPSGRSPRSRSERRAVNFTSALRALRSAHRTSRLMDLSIHES